MMTNDDAELLLDENFIAMDESDPFDCLDDENNPYYTEPKFKKKNDFNFTSLWRKPKIGRRKTRSIGKNQDAYERTFNDKSSSLRTKGKYVKDRESFETMASVPLSDFDEAKDTLPFLHFRPGSYDTRKSSKEKTVLNPKMFLTQAPVQRSGIENQMKKGKSDGGKLSEEESRDIFKPIRNNNNNNHFDAFQILPKESPTKVKAKENTQKKQKEEESDDLFDKENLTEDSVYCGGLYQDHGPILSSLSEDTIHSDSVRGEQFLLDDNFNGNMHEIGPRNKWNASQNDFEELEEDARRFRDVSNQNEEQRVETIQTRDSSVTIETGVRSFSDRLKLFQSKANQPAQQFKFDSRKPKSSTPTGNLPDPEVIKYGEETNDGVESTIVPETSEFENQASALEKCESFVEYDISKSKEEIVDKVNRDSTSELKANVTAHSNSFDKDKNSSRLVRNHFKQLQTTAGTIASTPSHQIDSHKHINDKKSLTTKKFRDGSQEKISVFNPEKVQSKVVDLSLIETYRNKVANKNICRDEAPILTNSTEASFCSEGENVDSIKAGNDSRSMPRSSIRSYNTNYRSSLNSYQSAREFEGKILGRRESKPTVVESKLTPEIDEVAKMASSEGALNKLEAKQAPLELQTKTSEMKDEKPRDSFMAATLRFGRKLEQSENKFGRNVVTNIQRADKKEVSEQEEDERKKIKHAKVHNSGNADNIYTKKSAAFGAKKSFESLISEVDIDDGTAPSLNGVQNNNTKSSVMNLKDSNLRKSSLNSQSEKTNVGYSAPSLAKRTVIINALDATSLESENKTDPKHEVSNDSTANTTISSLTCDSILPTSFAQQSANIFGVTLSKRRKNRIENTAGQKERSLNEKAIEAVACVEQRGCQSGLDDSHTTKPQSGVVEIRLQENKKPNVIDEEFRRRKISTSSISIYNIDGKMKDETSQLNQEEGPPVVEHSISNRRIGSSCQPLKLNKNDVGNPIDDGTQLDETNLKENRIALPQKLKTLSISDRRRMFEQATVKNDDLQDTARTDSPKSIETSGSTSSFDDLSVSTKRRSTESGIKSVNGVLQSQLRQVETSLNMSRCNDDEDDDIVANRRKTLKSNRGTVDKFGSFQPQPKSCEGVFHVLDKSEVLPNKPKDNIFGINVDDNLNRLEDRSKTLQSAHKEKNNTEHAENSVKETSPPRTAYSARRKFFENLDRKQVQSSMSRPLVGRIEPVPINNNSQKEHEIGLFKDDTVHESNGLPMFVTVEEDFMIKDNISTCLSASENRSVVCRPDDLLYSVSQKAIALMSAKVENNSTISHSRARRDKDRGTIHKCLDQKRLLSQGLKSNREESSTNITATKHSELRSRFARKKATKNEEETIGDAQDEDTKEIGLPVDIQQAKKIRTSDFSQRSNRSARKQVRSENCHQSKYKEEALIITDVYDKSNMKRQSSSEDKESSKKRTTVPLNRSKYNRFAGKKAESEICQTQQLPIKEDISYANNDVQGISDKSRPSTNSVKEPKNKIAVPSARQFERNLFVRNDFVSEMRNETESKDFHKMEGKSEFHARNADNKVRCINENITSAIEYEEIQEKQKTSPNSNVKVVADSQKAGTMSIRARRKFFESQCEKGSIGRNKLDKEESIVLDNSCKNAVSISNCDSSFNDGTKIRTSEDSEMTPLAGANIVDQCKPLARNIDSESTSRTSDLRERVSSTSMGTLDYSLPSSSNSVPSDVNKRASSVSTNTHGSSSALFYRKGLSSTVIRSSTSRTGNKKSDLRCF